MLLARPPKRFLVPLSLLSTVANRNIKTHQPPISFCSFPSSFATTTDSTTYQKSKDEDFLVFRDVTIGEILQKKAHSNRGLVWAQEQDTVYEAISRMVEMNIGSIVVKNSKGVTTGIFTERDYLRKIALAGLTSKTTLIKDVMTRNLISVQPEKTARDCMELMSKNRFRHLPILNPTGDLLGMVSIGDLVNSVLQDYQTSVQFYREYFEGQYSKTNPTSVTE